MTLRIHDYVELQNDILHSAKDDPDAQNDGLDLENNAPDLPNHITNFYLTASAPQVHVIPVQTHRSFPRWGAAAPQILCTLGSAGVHGNG